MVNDVIRTRTEQVLAIGKEAVAITIELSQFHKTNTNHGFVLGICVAALMSGYAPMSQGWFVWLGHGAVKNWKRDLGI